MIDPRPRRAVQNLKTFHAIVVPDLCILKSNHDRCEKKKKKSNLSDFWIGLEGERILNSMRSFRNFGLNRELEKRCDSKGFMGEMLVRDSRCRTHRRRRSYEPDELYFSTPIFVFFFVFSLFSS